MSSKFLQNLGRASAPKSEGPMGATAPTSSNNTTTTSSNIHEIELRFPSSIYYADPYAAIRSVLGNDIEILDYKESNIILPDSNILVNVKYSAIDFDLFKLWKIEDTKITSQQSQKVVATKLRDTITNEILSDDKIEDSKDEISKIEDSKNEVSIS